jgi:arylsulfatase A-like enzyme
MRLSFVKLTAGFILLTLFTAYLARADEKPPNILFIAIDDLRVQRGPYDRDNAHTPNLDKLAAQGVAFSRAYSNVPVCGASRSSMLSGLRPTPERFLAFVSTHKEAPGIVTLPQHFKDNGYYTISLGKVFNNKDDSLQACSETPWRPTNDKVSALVDKASNFDYVLPENIKAIAKGKQYAPPYEMADVGDDAYKEGKLARRAIEDLQRLKNLKQPFFLAVGFKKPHLPFNAPKKYWDMHSANLSANPLMAKNAPRAADHNWGELRGYALVPDKREPVPDELARTLRHGYHAATSYSDAMAGRVIKALEELDLAENTIVLVWGDHGWSLGDHGLWAKHSSFNVANQVELLVRAPGILKGKVQSGLVESIDIYPTVVELAGLSNPAHLQGKSLVPMLTNPVGKGKQAVFPRWKNADSIRTDRYFYTEWRNKQGRVTARMLYDHEKDPDETINVAAEAAYAQAVDDLSARLANHMAGLH